jgi:hypothetical protein
MAGAWSCYFWKSNNYRHVAKMIETAAERVTIPATSDWRSNDNLITGYPELILSAARSRRAHRGWNH